MKIHVSDLLLEVLVYEFVMVTQYIRGYWLFEDTTSQDDDINVLWNCVDRFRIMIT